MDIRFIRLDYIYILPQISFWHNGHWCRVLSILNLLVYHPDSTAVSGRLEPDQRAALGQEQRRGGGAGVGRRDGAVRQGARAASADHCGRGRLLPGQQLRSLLVRLLQLF